MKSNYTVKVAAQNLFSKPVAAASASNDKFIKGVQASRAEIKKLSSTERKIKLFASSKKNLAGMSGDLNALQKELKAVNTGQGKLVNTGKGLDKNKARTQAAIEAVQQQIQGIKKLEEAGVNLSQSQRKNFQRDIAKHQKTLAGHEKELTALERKARQNKLNLALSKKEQSALKAKVKSVTKSYEKEQRSLKAVQKELIRTGVDTRDLAGSQTRLKSKTLQANKALEAQKAQLKSVSEQEKRLTRLQDKRQGMTGKVAKTAAGMLAVYGTVNQAADFQTAMVEVEKKASFKNINGTELSPVAQAVKLANLERQILSSAPNLGLQPEELASIIASGAGSNVARAGHETEDLQRYSVLAAKMSNAFDNLTPQKAGESVAAWRASMGLSMAQTEMLGGAINHLSDNSAASTGALTDVITDVGAVVMSTGMSEIQTAGLSAAILAANGNKAEMGRTAAKNLALNLTLGEAASGSQQKMMQSLGLNAVQVSKDVQKDAVGTMYKVFESINKQPKYRRSAVIETLFGRESIGSIMPLIKNMDELKRVMLATSESAKIKTSLDREFNKLQQTYNFQQTRSISQLSSFTTAVGDQLLPVMTRGMEVLGDVVGAGTEFIKNNEALAGVIIKGAAALATYKAAQVAYRLGAVSLDIVMSRRKLNETKLGGAVGRTSRNATFAAAALDKLNRSLARTGARGLGGGLGGAAAAGLDTGDRKARKKPRGKGRFRAMASMAKSSRVPLVSTIAGAGMLAGSMVGGDTKDIATDVGSIGGSMAGAAAGAALGSIIPVVGTVAGGIIGAIAGESLGSWAGEWVGGEITKPEPQVNQVAKAEPIKPDLPVRTVDLNALSLEQVTALKQPEGLKPLANLMPVTRNQVKIDFRPNIQVDGDADQAKIEQALKASESSFMESLKQEFPAVFGPGSLQDHLDTSLGDGIPGELAF